ncbi:hypothetical protein GZL_00219 [Streptomyces sp. 769]|nr:hypothetical protein GZL_00219 [Streptomyces sp. 769]
MWARRFAFHVLLLRGLGGQPGLVRRDAGEADPLPGILRPGSCGLPCHQCRSPAPGGSRDPSRPSPTVGCDASPLVGSASFSLTGPFYQQHGGGLQQAGLDRHRFQRCQRDRGLRRGWHGAGVRRRRHVRR